MQRLHIKTDKKGKITGVDWKIFLSLKLFFTALILLAAMFCTAQDISKTNIAIIHNAERSGLADVSNTVKEKAKISPSAHTSSTCAAATVTDLNGNVYSTVQIGDQCWMGENLRVGIMIPGYTPQTNNGIKDKHCYGDLPSNCNTYGGLYQWGELMQYSGQAKTQGICPTGWNIPASGDFTWLGYIAGDSAGGKLKTTGTIEGTNGLWHAPNTMALNSVGFSALPGGWTDESGNFENLGYYAFLYTSEGWWDCCAYFLQLSYNDGYLNNASWVMRSRSLSVRCIKNATTLPTVSTSSISGIAATTAVGGGNVTNDGGAAVTARGVVWSTTPNPTVTNYAGITTNGTGVGMFSGNLTSLAPATTYYVKAYATNILGTVYGAQAEFMTLPSILAVSGLVINAGTDTCFNATQTINVSNVTVKNGGSATFISGGKILLQPVTKVESGGHLHASITTNASYCILNKSMITIIEEELPQEMKTMDIVETSALFTLSPNPTAGTFTLKMVDFDATQVIQIEIYGLMGDLVMQSKLSGQPQYEFDLTGRPKGMYFIRVTAGNKMGVGKLIKQ
jgi:uncharacterized protein (TIGR02145 family)